MSTAIEEVKNLVSTLSEAANELSEAWNNSPEIREALETNYPFSQSMDEMTIQIAFWKNGVVSRFNLFAEANQRFVSKQRFIVMIGDNEDNDYDDRFLAQKRAENLQTQFGDSAITIKAYWYVSVGFEDDYLIAQHFEDETEAAAALNITRQRWVQGQMRKFSESI